MKLKNFKQRAQDLLPDERDAIEQVATLEALAHCLDSHPSSPEIEQLRRELNAAMLFSMDRPLPHLLGADEEINQQIDAFNQILILDHFVSAAHGRVNSCKEKCKEEINESTKFELKEATTKFDEWLRLRSRRVNAQRMINENLLRVFLEKYVADGINRFKPLETGSLEVKINDQKVIRCSQEKRKKLACYRLNLCKEYGYHETIQSTSIDPRIDLPAEALQDEQGLRNKVRDAVKKIIDLNNALNNYSVLAACSVTDIQKLVRQYLYLDKKLELIPGGKLFKEEYGYKRYGEHISAELLRRIAKQLSIKEDGYSLEDAYRTVHSFYQDTVLQAYLPTDCPGFQMRVIGSKEDLDKLNPKPDNTYYLIKNTKEVWCYSSSYQGYEKRIISDWQQKSPEQYFGKEIFHKPIVSLDGDVVQLSEENRIKLSLLLESQGGFPLMAVSFPALFKEPTIDHPEINDFSIENQASSYKALVGVFEHEVNQEYIPRNTWGMSVYFILVYGSPSQRKLIFDCLNDKKILKENSLSFLEGNDIILPVCFNNPIFTQKINAYINKHEGYPDKQFKIYETLSKLSSVLVMLNFFQSESESKKAIIPIYGEVALKEIEGLLKVYENVKNDFEDADFFMEIDRYMVDLWRDLKRKFYQGNYQLKKDGETVSNYLLQCLPLFQEYASLVVKLEDLEDKDKSSKKAKKIDNRIDNCQQLFEQAFLKIIDKIISSNPSICSEDETALDNFFDAVLNHLNIRVDLFQFICDKIIEADEVSAVLFLPQLKKIINGKGKGLNEHLNVQEKISRILTKIEGFYCEKIISEDFSDLPSWLPQIVGLSKGLSIKQIKMNCAQSVYDSYAKRFDKMYQSSLEGPSFFRYGDEGFPAATDQFFHSDLDNFFDQNSNAEVRKKYKKKRKEVAEKFIEFYFSENPDQQLSLNADSLKDLVGYINAAGESISATPKGMFRTRKPSDDEIAPSESVTVVSLFSRKILSLFRENGSKEQLARVFACLSSFFEEAGRNLEDFKGLQSLTALNDAHETLDDWIEKAKEILRGMSFFGHDFVDKINEIVQPHKASIDASTVSSMSGLSSPSGSSRGSRNNSEEKSAAKPVSAISPEAIPTTNYSSDNTVSSISGLSSPSGSPLNTRNNSEEGLGVNPISTILPEAIPPKNHLSNISGYLEGFQDKLISYKTNKKTRIDAIKQLNLKIDTVRSCLNSFSQDTNLANLKAVQASLADLFSEIKNISKSIAWEWRVFSNSSFAEVLANFDQNYRQQIAEACLDQLKELGEKVCQDVLDEPALQRVLTCYEFSGLEVVPRNPSKAVISITDDPNKKTDIYKSLTNKYLISQGSRQSDDQSDKDQNQNQLVNELTKLKKALEEYQKNLFTRWSVKQQRKKDSGNLLKQVDSLLSQLNWKVTSYADLRKIENQLEKLFADSQECYDKINAEYILRSPDKRSLLFQALQPFVTPKAKNTAQIAPEVDVPVKRNAAKWGLEMRCDPAILGGFVHNDRDITHRVQECTYGLSEASLMNKTELLKQKVIDYWADKQNISAHESFDALWHAFFEQSSDLVCELNGFIKAVSRYRDGESYKSLTHEEKAQKIAMIYGVLKKASEETNGNIQEVLLDISAEWVKCHLLSTEFTAFPDVQKGYQCFLSGLDNAVNEFWRSPAYEESTAEEKRARLEKIYKKIQEVVAIGGEEGQDTDTLFQANGLAYKVRAQWIENHLLAQWLAGTQDCILPNKLEGDSVQCYLQGFKLAIDTVGRESSESVLAIIQKALNEVENRFQDFQFKNDALYDAINSKIFIIGVNLVSSNMKNKKLISSDVTIKPEMLLVGFQEACEELHPNENPEFFIQRVQDQMSYLPNINVSLDSNLFKVLDEQIYYSDLNLVKLKTLIGQYFASAIKWNKNNPQNRVLFNKLSVDLYLNLALKFSQDAAFECKYVNGDCLLSILDAVEENDLLQAAPNLLMPIFELLTQPAESDQAVDLWKKFRLVFEHRLMDKKLDLNLRMTEEQCQQIDAYVGRRLGDLLTDDDFEAFAEELEWLRFLMDKTGTERGKKIFEIQIKLFIDKEKRSLKKLEYFDPRRAKALNKIITNSDEQESSEDGKSERLIDGFIGKLLENINDWRKDDIQKACLPVAVGGLAELYLAIGQDKNDVAQKGSNPIDILSAIDCLCSDAEAFNQYHALIKAIELAINTEAKAELLLSHDSSVSTIVVSADSSLFRASDETQATEDWDAELSQADQSNFSPSQQFIIDSLAIAFKKDVKLNQQVRLALLKVSMALLEESQTELMKDPSFCKQVLEFFSVENPERPSLLSVDLKFAVELKEIIQDLSDSAQSRVPTSPRSDEDDSDTFYIGSRNPSEEVVVAVNSDPDRNAISVLAQECVDIENSLTIKEELKILLLNLLVQSKSSPVIEYFIGEKAIKAYQLKDPDYVSRWTKPTLAISPPYAVDYFDGQNGHVRFSFDSYPVLKKASEQFANDKNKFKFLQACCRIMGQKDLPNPITRSAQTLLPLFSCDEKNVVNLLLDTVLPLGHWLTKVNAFEKLVLSEQEKQDWLKAIESIEKEIGESPIKACVTAVKQTIESGLSGKLGQVIADQNLAYLKEELGQSVDILCGYKNNAEFAKVKSIDLKTPSVARFNEGKNKACNEIEQQGKSSSGKKLKVKLAVTYDFVWRVKQALKQLDANNVNGTLTALPELVGAAQSDFKAGMKDLGLKEKSQGFQNLLTEAIAKVKEAVGRYLKSVVDLADYSPQPPSRTVSRTYSSSSSSANSYDVEPSGRVSQSPIGSLTLTSSPTVKVAKVGSSGTLG